MIKSMCQQPAQGFTTTWVLESENISLRKKGEKTVPKNISLRKKRETTKERACTTRIQRTKTTARTATKKVVYTEERGVFHHLLIFVATCCLVGFGRVEGFV